MIKNKNLKIGLLVFIITLIGLITLVELYPEDKLDVVGSKSVNTEITKNN